MTDAGLGAVTQVSGVFVDPILKVKSLAEMALVRSLTSIMMPLMPDA